jgi:hypothetical protein
VLHRYSSAETGPSWVVGNGEIYCIRVG